MAGADAKTFWTEVFFNVGATVEMVVANSARWSVSESFVKPSKILGATDVCTENGTAILSGSLCSGSELQSVSFATSKGSTPAASLHLSLKQLSVVAPAVACSHLRAPMGACCNANCGVGKHGPAEGSDSTVHVVDSLSTEAVSASMTKSQCYKRTNIDYICGAVSMLANCGVHMNAAELEADFLPSIAPYSDGAHFQSVDSRADVLRCAPNQLELAHDLAAIACTRAKRPVAEELVYAIAAAMAWSVVPHDAMQHVREQCVPSPPVGALVKSSNCTSLSIVESVANTQATCVFLCSGKKWTAYGCELTQHWPALDCSRPEQAQVVDVSQVLNHIQTVWTPFDHDSVTAACNAAATAAAVAAVQWFADKHAAEEHNLCMTWLCTSAELQQLSTSISLTTCSDDSQHA